MRFWSLFACSPDYQLRPRSLNRDEGEGDAPVEGTHEDTTAREKRVHLKTISRSIQTISNQTWDRRAIQHMGWGVQQTRAR